MATSAAVAQRAVRAFGKMGRTKGYSPCARTSRPPFRHEAAGREHCSARSERPTTKPEHRQQPRGGKRMTHRFVFSAALAAALGLALTAAPARPKAIKNGAITLGQVVSASGTDGSVLFSVPAGKSVVLT